MRENDDFAKYYTHMINHPRKELMEPIHQLARAALGRPAAPGAGDGGAWRAAGQEGSGAAASS